MKYLSALDEDLRDCIDEGNTLSITGNKCASAAVLGDITVVDQRGAKVGCYASSTFSELFLKDYFDGSHESGQYLMSAFRHYGTQDRLYMSFSGGSLVVQPLPKDFVKHDKNSREQTEMPQSSTFNLTHTILAFAAFGKTHLLGVGREGCIYTFDISTDAIKIPNKTKLEDIDDIYSIQPL
jgi:hypothetical protein